MKLLGISGSLRRASFNTVLLHAAQELLPAGVVLRRAGAIVEPPGEVLVFQAHTKIADGKLIDERTREVFARHLQAFVAQLPRAI